MRNTGSRIAHGPPSWVQDCAGVVGVIEELKCRARSLQQQGRALDRLVGRLEAAAEADAAETGVRAPACQRSHVSTTYC